MSKTECQKLNLRILWNKQSLSLPAGSQVHQLAQSLSERLETSLTELGLDVNDMYHMSRGQQLELIDQVTDKVLSNQDLGELARLVEQEHLTQAQNRGKVDTNEHLSKISEDAVTENNGLSLELIQELKTNNIKFSQKDMLFITKDATNQIVWLEKGNQNAGLEHIVNGNGISKGHSQDFFNAFGVTQDELPSYLEKVITVGTVVSNRLKSIGKHQGYERIYYYNGGYHVVTGIGTNGFIVSAYPKRT